jgi:hypothetical protein
MARFEERLAGNDEGGFRVLIRSANRKSSVARSKKLSSVGRGELVVMKPIERVALLAG